MIAAIQLEAPRAMGVAFILFWCVLAVVVWFYRSQLSPSQARARWMLPALRAVALGTLVLAFLQPQIVTPVGDLPPGAVAILVDQSRSMSAVDSTWSDAELVELAAALGALPEGARPSAMSDLRDAVQELIPIAQEIERSLSEERYARLAGRGIEAAERHVREAQNELRRRVSDLAPTALDPLSGMIWLIDNPDASERISDVISRIDQLQAEADGELYQQNPMVREVCAMLAQSSRRELVSRALEGDAGLISRLSLDRPVKVVNLTHITGPTTAPVTARTAEPTTRPGYADVAAAVRAVRGEQDDQRLAAVVILTDGQPGGNGAGDSGIDAAIPVFVVSAAAPVTRDVSIDRVWLPERAFTGQFVPVSVDIRATGFVNAEVEVTVQSDAQEQIRRVSMIDGHARAQIPIRAGQPGPQEVQIAVKPVAGEATTENNRAGRVFKVASERIRVALFAGRVTRDLEYFRDALKEDPGVIALDRIIDSPERAPGVEQITQQDVVVLVDLPHTALDSRQWDALIRLVNQKGGSVIFATADPLVASGYASNALAAGLLPWRGDVPPALSAWPGAEPVFRINPATASNGLPRELWDESEPGSPRWSEIPPVYRFLSLPPLRNPAEALLIERDSGLPVLAQLRLGAGRTLFIGLNELWRWRGALDYEHADRLYARLIHHGSCQQFSAADGALALDIQPLVAAPGQPVQVRARAGPGAMVEVIRGDAPVLSRPLVQEPGKASLETTLPELPQGEYRLRLRAPDYAGEVVLPFWVREGFEAEMRDVSSDPTELRRLAGARGEVMSLADIHTLPDRLAKLKEPDPLPVQTRLWDSPYLYCFVVACLGLEWAMRKRFGLA